MLACHLLTVVLSSAATFVHSTALFYSTERHGVEVPNMKAESPEQDGDQHVYLFVSDGKKKPYSYVDDFGKLTGFDIDFVSEVCSLADKRCYSILAEFTECIFTDRNIDYAGRGLMASWFDGCPGYQITIDRQNEFDFTLPYLTSSASFAVSPGNPSRFNPDLNDFSTFKILHLTGAPTNVHCLKRLHKLFGTVIVAQDLSEARSLLLNGSADVLFSPRNEIDGLTVFPQRVHCDNGGAGIMLKKGSIIPSWWNPAFQKFYLSGEYTNLCNKASLKYGGKIQCLLPQDQMSSDTLTLINAPLVSKQEKLWKFVVTGRIKPYSYLDDEGYLVGFTKDLLETICKRARKRCVLLLAQVQECTVRKGELLYPGRGLMEGWFDACTGYFDTQDRENSWDFTSPYLVSNASFFVFPGNPTGFDPDSDDYSSFTIVYQATAITNNHCLNRLHKKFGDLLVVKSKDIAISFVLNGTADTWFTKEVGVSGLEQLPQRLHCENVGSSIMTKKGGQLPSWWNVAFKEFYFSGDYQLFCTEKGGKYSYNFPCIEGPNNSGSPCENP